MKGKQDVKSESPTPSQSEKQTDSGTVQQLGGEITGRSVFMVDTSAAGIVVQTRFMREDGQLLEFPAVFPNLGYALDQIDHLRRIVIERFEQAAQVGVQVIAANSQQTSGASADDTGPHQPID
jgi:hypothetical protein